MTEANVQDRSILERRKRDYVLLLVFMILSFVALGPMNKLMPPGSFVPVFFSTVTIIPWYLVCYRVTANFYQSSLVRWMYAGLLIFQLTFNGYINFRAEMDATSLAFAASIGYAANLIGFGFIFYILLRDIFRQRHDLVYSLLGASNIYLLIPILFCYVYCLLSVNDPTLMGADPNRIDTVLLSSFNYSLHILSGVDYPVSIHEGLQLVGALEALVGNLFMVFIIGRLMTK